MMRVTAVLSILLIALIACGCGRSKDGGRAQKVSAENFDRHECESCGMVVSEQTAPRGQLLHRDGTRLYFCSVSDMLTYMEAPSPHGAAVGVFVEVMADDEDPLANDPAPHPWILASKAGYVVGVEKPMVMGRSIFVYDSIPKAQEVAERLGGSTNSWAELRASSEH